MNTNDVVMFGAIQDLCDSLQASLLKQFPDADNKWFTIEMGRRYFSVWRSRGDTRNKGTVVLFVDRTNGDILKPASWRGPAKGARGNILTGLKEAQAKCDWAGRWLYKIKI